MLNRYFNIFSIFLLVIVLILFLVLCFIPEKKDSFAAIYLLNQDGKFGNYSDNVTIGVANNLGYETEFTVFYKKDNSTMHSWGKELGDNQSWEFYATLENNSENNIFELWYKTNGNWVYSNQKVGISKHGD